jgi:amidophosphoribosyltransferase
MPAADELVAHNRTVEDIERELGCDWLIYQDLEDLEAAVREGNPNLADFDSSCFDGQYVTGIEPGYFERIEQARSDEAKRKRRVG